jgi:hypothetical protein
MKRFIQLVILFILFLQINKLSAIKPPSSDTLHFFEADNPMFQFVGRIDFSNVKQPRFWSPGVYIKAKFKGSTCKLLVNDQELWGKITITLKL